MPDIVKGNPNQISLTLKQNRYDVSVGINLIEKLGQEIEGRLGGKAALVSDDNVFPLYGEAVSEALQKIGIEVVPIIVPAGEASKCCRATTGRFATQPRGAISHSTLTIFQSPFQRAT